MNKLYNLKYMGFKITWHLIAIGLIGNDEIPPLITHLDVVEYLDGLLEDTNEQTDVITTLNVDNIIALIIEKDDYTKFDNVLKELAREDAADIFLQKRKWRAFLLKQLIDNISEDCLQGLLELMEFWISMGNPEDCPQAFPSNDNKKTAQDFFTQASYELNINKNREWLNEEVLSIVKSEG